MAFGYAVTCECGNETGVARSQCGTLVDCRYGCGRQISVPRLSQLRPREPMQYSKVIGPAELIRVPALALLVAAVSTIVISIAALVFATSLLEWMKSDEYFVLFCANVVFVIAVNCFIAFGAIQMSRFRQHGITVAASILSLLLGFFPIGLIAGLWALSVLHKESVREAFGP